MQFIYRLRDRTRNTARTQGSVLVETAILMPLVLVVLLTFVRLLQILAVQNCVEQATFKAAQLLRKYGIVYHTYGVSRLENVLLDQLEIDLRDSFVDLRGYMEAGTDLLYEEVACRIVNYYLQRDSLVQKGYVAYSGLSCKGSTFFHHNEDIELSVRCFACSFVPVGTRLRFRVWVRGDSPTVSLTESGVSVWTFHNFTRGRILRDIFGGDLPYDYPVIASFKNGEACMIKSIDITQSSYQNPDRLTAEIRSMIDKLADFQGTEDNSRVEDSLRISAASIQTRRLLLIFPTNPMRPEQTTAISNVLTTYSVAKDVQVEIQLFQESPQSS